MKTFNGMNADSDPELQQQVSATYMRNAKMPIPPDEAARNYASRYSGEDINKVIQAWLNGYTFGNNEVMEKWTNYVAMQPPKPIEVKTTEINIETYKMFIGQKIAKDSSGKFWAKVKLWFKFLMA